MSLHGSAAAHTGGVHADGDAPQTVSRVDGLNVLFAGDAVEDAEDDGIRADELFHVPDGLFQHSGLDGHQKEVHRLALLGGDVVKMALLAVADHRLGRVAGDAPGVRNDLHAGHLPAKKNAQCTQTDEGRSLDLFHAVPLLFQFHAVPEHPVSLADALPYQRGVGAGQGLPGAVRRLHRHITADLGPFGQLLAAIHLFFDAQNAAALHLLHLLPRSCAGRFPLL